MRRSKLHLQSHSPRCWRREEVQESQGPGVPRYQGPKDEDISNSHSNTSLTLKEVHLVLINTWMRKICTNVKCKCYILLIVNLLQILTTFNVFFQNLFIFKSFVAIWTKKRVLLLQMSF